MCSSARSRPSAQMTTTLSHPRAYIESDGYLLLPDERRVLQTIQRAEEDYGPEARDWLRAQALLNRLVSAAVNGESPLSRRWPSSWVYRYLWPAQRLWRAPIGNKPEGRYTRGVAERMDGARDLGALYQALREGEELLGPPPAELATEPRSAIAPEHAPGEGHPAVSAMRRALAPLDQDVSVYVHGSTASGDRTPFSDLDDLVVVHADAWSSYTRFAAAARRLEGVARQMEVLDPLQHHGHWVVTDLDLRCLDESVMPLVVLEGAVQICGPRELRARARTDGAGFTRVMWGILQEVRRETLALMAGELNLFGLKDLISGISLLPALTFQSRGRMVDKLTAIRRCEELFSEEALPAIRWATCIRQEWGAVHPGWIRRTRALYRVSPFRRDALETRSRRSSPRVDVSALPGYSEKVGKAVLRLTDECGEAMGE